MSSLRVLKLGGSQLESADCVQRVLEWLQAQPPARTLMLVGGGPPVDAIREMAQGQANHGSGYDEEFLHWLCIDAMDISFRLVAEKLKPYEAWTILRSHRELQDWIAGHATTFGLVHIAAFYRADNYRQLPLALPLSWETTSDSLAALLATIIDAEELVILKSCRVDESRSWTELARAGIVDAAFPDAVKHIRKARVVTL